MKRIASTITLMFLAGSAQAAGGEGAAVQQLLVSAHEGNVVAFQASKTATARISDERRGRRAKAKAVEASDFNPFFQNCTLFDMGAGEGSDWTLSWKCGENYSLMIFHVPSGRVAEVTIIDGPPWLVTVNVEGIRFPQVVKAD